MDSISEFEGYKNVTLTSDNAMAVKQSDILIFAVQPFRFVSILNEISPFLTENHVLISTVTGFGISKIESIVGKDQFIVRAMPNTAISVGQSMTCITTIV